MTVASTPATPTRLLFLPCDTRPPTLELPQQLARLAGLELLAPPLALLNHLNQPGDCAALADWLRAHAPSAAGAIITLETLTLGGMIPARRVSTNFETALGHLQVLRDIKAAQPDFALLAYGVIVRVGHDNDPLEEKPYYGEHGPALRAFSTALDRHERRADPDDHLLEAARAALPADILADWLATRERNHAIHLAAIDLLHDGVLDHLCLTLDDTTLYGLAGRDRRRLEAKLDQLALWPKADVYPGADEVAAALIARFLVNKRGKKVPIFVRYPSELAAQSLMLYEDRVLGELVKVHLRAAGCIQVASPQEAKLILAVNAPTTRQSHREPDFELVDTANRSLPEFIDQIEHDLAKGLAVAVADVAIANGAEWRFTQQLLDRIALPQLAGYAAWNTAGNTIGSAIAHGLCRILAQDQHNSIAHLEALLSRFVDDAIYQGRVRGQLRGLLNNPSPFDLGDQKPAAERQLQALMQPAIQEFWQQKLEPHANGLKLELAAATLAWPRLFTGVFPLRITQESPISPAAQPDAPPA
jgi:hypothetical protein